MWILIGIVVFIMIVMFLYKRYLLQSLYKQYLFLNEDKVKYEINKEYLNEKENDYKQTVYDDLELEKVFHFINYTQSDIGKEYMFGRMFMKPTHHQELEKIIEHLNDEKILKSCLYYLYELDKGYSQSLGLFKKLKAFDFIDYLGVILVYVILVSICVFGLILHDYQSVVKLGFIWLFVTSMFYMRVERKYEEIMGQTISYCYVVDIMQSLLKLHIFTDEKELSQILMTAKKHIFIQRVFSKLSKVGLFELANFIKSLFLLNVIQAYIINKHKSKLEHDYIRMYESIGLVDMALSVKKIREHYDVCVPIQGYEVKIDMKECYHPLISNPVKNSFHTHQSCMITGSNASGKSTFIKTIGVNLILAKAIHTCFGDEFYYGDFPILTSIHMKDDLLSGESYYVKEIKTLKEIIETVHKQKCYVFIDEILRGTNEKERIEISRVLIDDLLHYPSVSFITTHDLSIVDYFLDIPQYCFMDEVKNHQLYCDYKIRNGICRIGNAVKLLEVYDYDQELLSKIRIKQTIS